MPYWNHRYSDIAAAILMASNQRSIPCIRGGFAQGLGQKFHNHFGQILNRLRPKSCAKVFAQPFWNKVNENIWFPCWTAACHVSWLWWGKPSVSTLMSHSHVIKMYQYRHCDTALEPSSFIANPQGSLSAGEVPTELSAAAGGSLPCYICPHGRQADMPDADRPTTNLERG